MNVMDLVNDKHVQILHSQGTSGVSDQNDNISKFLPIIVNGWIISGIFPIYITSISALAIIT